MRLAGHATERADTFADLRQWLKDFPGNQRALLAALREDWMEALRKRDQGELGRILRKAIKSPKLSADREALIAELAQAAQPD